MLTRRSVLAGIASLASGVLLAACTAPEQQATAPTSKPEAPAAAPTQVKKEPSAAATAKPTEAPSAAKPASNAPVVEIRWGTWASGTGFDVMKNMAESFNQKNPDASIKMETAPWQQYWDKMQVQLAAGTAPDIVWMSGATFLNLVEKGGLLALDDLVRTSGFRFEDFYGQPKIFDWQGKKYGLPWAMTVQLLLVNKTAFNKAGVELPPEKWNDPTWTWIEFLEKAKTLTKGTDFYGAKVTNEMEQSWANFIWSNGGDILSQDEQHTTLDTPEAIEGLKFAVDLINIHKVAPKPGDPSVFQAGAPSPFALNRIGMEFGSSAYAVGYLAQIKDNFDWGFYPLPKAPKADAKPRPSYNGNPLSATSSTKYKDQAFRALAHLASAESMKFLAETKLMMPALKESANNDPYTAAPPTGLALAGEGMEFAQDLRFTKVWLEWLNRITAEVDKAFIGEASAEDAARAAAREGDKALHA